MNIESYIANNDAFVFELDGVLYPEKDFYLQVYYLFGQFMEYSEQLDGQAIVQYMQQTYAAQGHEGLFEKTAGQFGIDEKYKLNFDLLLRNIRLPLKLLLFESCMRFMKHIVQAGKPLLLLVAGNPEAQLNKIKQVEWQGLEQYLTVYFEQELQAINEGPALAYVAAKHDLQGKRILMINRDTASGSDFKEATLNYLSANELING